MVSRDEVENSVTQHLRTIFKAIQAHSKKVESSCGLSSVRLWMLHEIDSTPGIRVSELAARLSIHRSTCSNMLDKLEDKDLIYRNRSKADQRSVRLYLTEQGKDTLTRAPAPQQGQLSNGLGKLSEEQLGELEKQLSALVQALHYDDAKAGLTPILP